MDLDALLRQVDPERIEALDRETREALLRYVEARVTVRRRVPIATWVPHAKQAAFIASPARIRVFLGGNRSGKTYVGVAEAVAHALGYRPWQVPDLALVGDPPQLPPRERVPESAWVRRADGIPIAVPNRGTIVSGQGMKRGIGPTIWPRLSEFWGRHLAPLKAWSGPEGVPTRVLFPNGSEIIFASAIQERMTFEGTLYHWVHADEPMSSYVFNGLWRGLTDTFGSIWFTQTPLGAASRWLYTAFVAARRPDCEVFTVGIRDNPYLEASAVEAFEATTTWTEEERAARLLGRFEFLSDVVWPQFRVTHHVVEPHEIPSDWARGLTVDPHLRKPWFLAWWAIDREGRIVFYREWPREPYVRLRTDSRAPADYAVLIRAEEGKERVVHRLMDPNFGRNPTVATRHGMRTLQAELAEYGLEFSCRINDSVDYGLGAVADALRCDVARPPVADNRPRLQFFSTCRNLIAAAEGFAYLPQRSDLKTHVLFSDEFKDGADVIRYTVVGPKARAAEPMAYLSDEDLRRWMMD